MLRGRDLGLLPGRVRWAILRQNIVSKMCTSNLSDGSNDEGSEQPNMWNGMLELFTLWEISPRLQRGLEDRDLGRVALTCRFAQDVLWVVSFIEATVQPTFEQWDSCAELTVHSNP